jgi:hypothetical protein
LGGEFGDNLKHSPRHHGPAVYGPSAFKKRPAGFLLLIIDVQKVLQKN